MQLDQLLATVSSSPAELVSWAQRRADELLAGRDPSDVLASLDADAPVRSLRAVAPDPLEAGVAPSFAARASPPEPRHVESLREHDSTAAALAPSEPARDDPPRSESEDALAEIASMMDEARGVAPIHRPEHADDSGDAIDPGHSIESQVNAALDELSSAMLDVGLSSPGSASTSDDAEEIETLDDTELVELDDDELELLSSDDD